MSELIKAEVDELNKLLDVTELVTAYGEVFQHFFDLSLRLRNEVKDDPELCVQIERGRERLCKLWAEKTRTMSDSIKQKALPWQAGYYAFRPSSKRPDFYVLETNQGCSLGICHWNLDEVILRAYIYQPGVSIEYQIHPRDPQSLKKLYCFVSCIRREPIEMIDLQFSANEGNGFVSIRATKTKMPFCLTPTPNIFAEELVCQLSAEKPPFLPPPSEKMGVDLSVFGWNN